MLIKKVLKIMTIAHLA